MMAATSGGSGITPPHSLNGWFEAKAIDAFSSRSVRIWKSGSDPWASSWT